MKNQKSEAQIMRECLCWLQHQYFCRAWRANTGVAKIGERFIHFGLPGQADITGILRDGRRLEVEVKTAIGKQSDKQKQFQETIEKFGGVYFLVRSLNDLISKFEGVKKNV